MEQHLQLAEARLLSPASLSDAHLDKVFSQMMSSAVDYGDLYFQTARYESWRMEDNIIKSGSYSIEQGVGVRVLAGEKTGFAYSDEIALKPLLESAQAARAIARRGQTGSLAIRQRGQAPQRLYSTDDPLESMSEVERIALLEEANVVARQESAYVQDVMVSLNGVHETVLIADSEGRLAADVRPLVQMNVTVIIAKDGKRETGSAGGGGRFGFDYFTQKKRVAGYAREAVRLALIALEAEEAPAGTMNVVLGPGWPGVLLHEAIGHGLEGDFNRKKTSAFSDRIGEQVAAKGVTVVDDGTMPERRGSLNVDDEGVTTQYNVLIEDGILKSYMQDRLNARLMGVAPTGNGRRESYAHLPQPRMTNTYMLAGERSPDEIIESVDKGLYAVNFSGGQVDITSGKFVFSASEAYLIENGKVTRPVKGATLIGNGPDVLTRVSMIGNDLELDPGIGVCGKGGQSVPVGVGQPTLRIDGLTVGGTAVG